VTSKIVPSDREHLLRIEHRFVRFVRFVVHSSIAATLSTSGEIKI
jgi:hypothetical protein